MRKSICKKLRDSNREDVVSLKEIESSNENEPVKSRCGHRVPDKLTGPCESTGATRCPVLCISEVRVYRSQRMGLGGQLPPDPISVRQVYDLSRPKNEGLPGMPDRNKPHGFSESRPTSSRSSSRVMRRSSPFSERSKADNSRSAFLGELSR
jgi:hypothetical protein